MISTERIDVIIRDSLFRDDEMDNGRPKDGMEFIEARGVVNEFGFHKTRLESHRAEIQEMLAELPDQFHAGKGGGWSFLNACMTRDDDQWGEQRDVDLLLCLGLGLGIVRYTLPREMWPVLPGGMPYFAVTLPGESSGPTAGDV
jgi:hypothetical protein